MKRHNLNMAVSVVLAGTIALTSGCAVSVNIGNPATPTSVAQPPTAAPTATADSAALDSDFIDLLESRLLAWEAKTRDVGKSIAGDNAMFYASPTLIAEMQGKVKLMQAEADALGSMHGPSKRTEDLRVAAKDVVSKYTSLLSDLPTVMKGAAAFDSYALLKAVEISKGLEGFVTDVQTIKNKIREARRK